MLPSCWEGNQLQKKPLTQSLTIYFLKQYKAGDRSVLSTLTQAQFKTFVYFWSITKINGGFLSRIFTFTSVKACELEQTLPQKHSLEAQQSPSLLAELPLLDFTRDKDFRWWAFTSLCKLISALCSQSLRRCSGRALCASPAVPRTLWTKWFLGTAETHQK